MSQRPMVGVGVLLFRAGKVLVGKRKGSHGAGDYALPGGHLEFGESFEECAAREVKEETGIDLNPSQVRFEYATNAVFKEIGRHYATIFMRAEVPDGVEAINTEPEKCEDWVWSDYNYIPEPHFLPLQTLLQSPYKPF